MNAILMDHELKKYFDQNKKMNLTVHSVFKEAINLIDEKGELITLLTHNKDIGPMGLILSPSSKNFSKIIPNELVEKKASTLYFKSSKVILNFSSAKEWKHEFRIMGSNGSQVCDLGKKTQRLRQILLERGEENGLLPLVTVLDSYFKVNDAIDLPGLVNNTYCDFIQDVFLEIVRLLSQQKLESVVELLPKFIGFGPGLTPSTDDFLSGVLLAQRASYLYREKSTDEIDVFSKNVYDFACGRTTKVSESMLKHISKGRASDSHMQLIESIYSVEDEAIEPYAIRVLMNGATSGSDFILGVYCSLLISQAI